MHGAELHYFSESRSSLPTELKRSNFAAARKLYRSGKLPRCCEGQASAGLPPPQPDQLARAECRGFTSKKDQGPKIKIKKSAINIFVQSQPMLCSFGVSTVYVDFSRICLFGGGLHRVGRVGLARPAVGLAHTSAAKSNQRGGQHVDRQPPSLVGR
jgi:hypothetical protein